MPDTALHAISFYPSYYPRKLHYGPQIKKQSQKGTNIINSKWQSRNSKPGGYNSCALLYIRVAASNPLWKNSWYK